MKEPEKVNIRYIGDAAFLFKGRIYSATRGDGVFWIYHRGYLAIPERDCEVVKEDTIHENKKERGEGGNAGVSPRGGYGGNSRLARGGDYGSGGN